MSLIESLITNIKNEFKHNTNQDIFKNVKIINDRGVKFNFMRFSRDTEAFYILASKYRRSRDRHYLDVPNAFSGRHKKLRDAIKAIFEIMEQIFQCKKCNKYYNVKYNETLPDKICCSCAIELERLKTKPAESKFECNICCFEQSIQIQVKSYCQNTHDGKICLNCCKKLKVCPYCKCDIITIEDSDDECSDDDEINY